MFQGFVANSDIGRTLAALRRGRACFAICFDGRRVEWRILSNLHFRSESLHQVSSVSGRRIFETMQSEAGFLSEGLADESPRASA